MISAPFCRAYAEALSAAFEGDPFYGAMTSGLDSPTEAITQYFEVSIQEALQDGLAGLTEGGPWGAALWSTPLASGEQHRKLDHKRSQIQRILGPQAAQIYTEISATMARISAPKVPAEDWYLSILGVHPDHRGRGLSSTLISEGIAHAARMGRGCWAETFAERNLAFYERFGFTCVAKGDDPLTARPFWTVHRPFRTD